MSWPIVVLICFSVMIFFIFAFLLTIYVMEFMREEKAIKEFMDLRKQQNKEISTLLDMNKVYVVDLPPSMPKKKVSAAPPEPIKNKKDIN